MIHHQFPTQYRGSVKEVIGPVGKNVIFRFTDSYSVFDWGKMPDSLNGKGQALTVIAAYFFEKLRQAETWKSFSRAPEALALRKGSRFGSAFNEIGEVLQDKGLVTHYVGVLDDDQNTPHHQPLSGMKTPPNLLMVEQVSVVRPKFTTVMGTPVADYQPTRTAVAPRLIPLEVVFRFSCPPGSSLLSRVQKDPDYLATLGYPGLTVAPGAKWDFPVIELYTKLESTDRLLTLPEALAISGISAEQLQDIMLRTAWVAGALKWICAQVGLELADGKLEWALTATGDSMLVDAIGPDELRLLFVPLTKVGEYQLSKEFLRTLYRGTAWYQAVEAAKLQAKQKGTTEWRKLVTVNPTKLSPEHFALASQLYQTLANHITKKVWFPEAWAMDRVISEIEKVK